MPQFNRKCNVVVWDKIDNTQTVIDNLRISFSVEKTRVSNTFDKAEISIYNLSKATREKISDTKIADSKIYVYLNVGYETITTHLFEGNLSSYSHSFEGADIVTRMTVYDGDDIARKHVKGSHKKNANPKQVLDNLIKVAGTNIDYKAVQNYPALKVPFASGYSYSDQFKFTLDDICNQIGADWTIQEGIVKICGNGEGVPGSIIFLDEKSGLVGVPIKIDDVTSKMGKNRRATTGKPPAAPGYTVKCLLNPKIKPYTVLRVKSNKIGLDSEVVVGAVMHTGDTHSMDWTSLSRVVIK